MSSEEDYFDELEYDLADEVNEEKEDIQTKKLTTVNCQTEKIQSIRNSSGKYRIIQDVGTHQS